MADKAIGKSSASIFLDKVKSSLGGNINLEPKDATEKWLYVSKSVSSSSSNLIDISYDYFGLAQAVALADVVRWICIKNTSTTNTDGIAICLDGGAAAWNNNHSMVIGSGEMLILKCASAVTFDDLHAIAITMDGTYGYPTATNSGTVSVEIAAIADDVS